MQVNHSQRGQTMVELAVSLPIALFCLFAIIYMGRFGVVSERAELALRYGGVTAFQTSFTYSLANMYANVATPQNTPAPCPTPPTTELTGGGPMPGPSPAPFWQPDTDTVKPSSSCTLSVQSLGGAQFLATHYVATTTVNVIAGIDVPSYLRALLGNAATVNTTAQFAHSAFPGLILYCSQEVHDRVWNAIYAESTTATPPPSAPNTGACH